VEKGEMQGALCKKGSFLFLLPFDPRTEEGRGPRAAALRWPSGHSRGWRDGERREGDEGVLSLSSPWVGAAREGGFTDGGGLVVAVLGGGSALVLRKGRGSVVAVRGEPGAVSPYL
jgi:hypothetical protein